LVKIILELVETSAAIDIVPDKARSMQTTISPDPQTPPAVDLLARFRAYVAETRLSEDGRLPNERTMAAGLGVTRAELRKCLAVLECEGHIWRQVGKGTFVGPRPPRSPDIAELAALTNPTQMMRARIALEPELARLAALNVSAGEIAELQELTRACRSARNWREYESRDARFHHCIANAARNPVLLAMLDTLNGVRRAVTWGRPRPEGDRPAPSHHSFDDHDAIVDAIAHGEAVKAADAMRRHLQTVEDRLVGRLP